MSRTNRTEQSSIIDIRRLGALIDEAPEQSSRTVRPSESAVALPTFGADQLSRPLAAPPPRAMPAAAPVLAAPPRSPETTVLLVAIGVLAIVVAGLTYYVAVRPAPQTIVREEVPAVAPVVTQAEAPKRNVVAVAAAPEPGEGKAAALADNPEAEEQTEPATEADPEASRPKGRRLPRAKPHPRTPAPTAEADPFSKPAPTKPTKPKADPANSDHLPAECVIDPKGCGLGAKPPIDGPKTKDEGEDLPNKLGQPAVRKGLAKVKAAAKQCGPRHGVRGETVQVKLTLRGSTGQVAQATPLSPHAGTPIGSCVAAALKKAKFDRFGASVQGVQYGVRL